MFRSAARPALAAALLLAAVAARPSAAADGELDPDFGSGGIAEIEGFFGQDIPLAIDLHPDGERVVVTGYNFFITTYQGVRTELDAAGTAGAPLPIPATDAARGAVWNGYGEFLGGWQGTSVVLTGPADWSGPFVNGPYAGFDVPRVAMGERPPAPGDWSGPYAAFTVGDGWAIVRTVFDADFSLAWTLDPTFTATPVQFDLGGDDRDVLSDLVIKFPGPDEKPLAAGWVRTGVRGPADSDFAVAQLQAIGQLDPDFGDQGKRVFPVDFDASGRDEVRAAAARADGWVALAGFSGASEDLSAGVVARIPPDGAASGVLVATFRLGGLATSFRDVAWIGDRLYVAGRIRDGAQSDVVVARLRRDLTLDPTFGTGGWVRVDASGSDADDQASSLTVQNGRPVVAAEVSTSDHAHFAVLRLTASLLFADGFEGGGTRLWTVAVQ